MKTSEQREYPELRFKGFDDEWEEKFLGNLANIETGSRNLQDAVEGGEYPFFVRSDKVERLNQYDFDEEAILVPGDGRIGQIFHYINGKFALHQRVYKVDNFKNIKPEFLIQLFKSSFQEHALKENAQGTVPSLRMPVFIKWKISIPNLNEQQKIGQFFKKLDELIGLYQKKLDKLKDLKKGYLQKVFPVPGKSIPELRFKGFYADWESHTFEDLASVAMNKRVFKNQTSDVGDIPFYKIGTFGSKPDSFITKELFNEYKNKYPYPKVGDILISASGSIGKTVEYQGKDEYFQDSNIVWLKHDNRLDNLFLKQFYLVVKWKGLEGSTIKRLYNKSILSTNISIPTTVEQQKIGHFFKKLDELIDNQSKQIDQLKELKKGYLQKMFV